MKTKPLTDQAIAQAVKTATERWNDDVTIVKEALKTKLWRCVPEQRQKWLDLVGNLSVLHGVEQPAFIVDPEIMPKYVYVTHEITINKWSVISMLHEFSHHVYGADEGTAFAYSNCVFLAAYKPARRKLGITADGWLVKKDQPEE